MLAASRSGLSVTELAEKLHTSKSTSSRLLASLVESGLVERDEAHRHFLDVRFWTWGVQAARRLPVLDIARPHLASVVKEWSNPASIAVVRGDQTIYLECLTPSNGDAMFNILSYAVPAYACAPGKAILAFSSDETKETILSSPLKKFTPQTLATREELSRELETVRCQGYAINRGEYYDNVSFAAAVPILDHAGLAVAAVSFYGLPDEASLQRLIPPLVEIGKVISASLGYGKAVRDVVG